MKFLLIVVVVFIALAPLWHFLPNKRQRQLMALRESAGRKGLVVEFRPRPPSIREREGEPLMYYGRRLPLSPADNVESMAWVRDQWGWRGLERPSDPPPFFSKLPDSVILAVLNRGGYGVYWDEWGGEETLAEIVGVLDLWGEHLQDGAGEIS